MIPPFNPHGSECKGHGIWHLDCTFENPDDRALMVRILDHYITTHRAPDTQEAPQATAGSPSGVLAEGTGL